MVCAHAIRRAGIPDVTFHDLRHTFASRLVRAGVDLTTVKELIGHQTIALTLRYARLSTGHKQRAVSTLERFGEKVLVVFPTGESAPAQESVQLTEKA